MSIKKGDLVMVVGPKQCCRKYTEFQGKIFTVTGLNVASWSCIYCGSRHESEPTVSGDGINCFELSRLKKIDPPSTGELDRVPVRMKEPA